MSLSIVGSTPSKPEMSLKRFCLVCPADEKVPGLPRSTMFAIVLFLGVEAIQEITDDLDKFFFRGGRQLDVLRAVVLRALQILRQISGRRAGARRFAATGSAAAAIRVVGRHRFLIDRV